MDNIRVGPLLKYMSLPLPPERLKKILVREGLVTEDRFNAVLKEADRISINEQLEEPKAVIQRMRQLPIWPKGAFS